MYVDDTDLEIVKHLWDGRTPYSEVAEKIGVTTNTVRARANKMMEAGALQIIGLIDPHFVKGHSAAFMGFRVEPSRIKEISDKIRTLTGVVAASCVSGGFNVMTVVMFNEEHTYSKFIFEELPKVEGILSFDTYNVVEAEKFNLRYVF